MSVPIALSLMKGELPAELDLIKFPMARRFIEACLRPQALRPSASDLLADEFLLPNEEDDFLEVRSVLSTLPETNDESDESEYEEDNGNESEVGARRRSNQWNYGKVHESLAEDIFRVGTSVDSSPVAAKLNHVLMNGDVDSRRLARGVLERSKSLPALAFEAEENGTMVPTESDTGNAFNEERTAPSSAVVTSGSSPGHQVSVVENERSVSVVGVEGTASDVILSNSEPPVSLGPVSVKKSMDDDASSTGGDGSGPALCSTSSGGVEGQGSAGSTGSLSVAALRSASSRVLRLCSPGDELYKTSRSASFSEMMERTSGSGTHRGGAPLLSTASFAAMSTSPADDGSRLLAMGNGGDSGAGITGADGTLLNSAPENFFGVVDVENKEENKDRCLIFRLRVPFENTFKEIEFEFDLQEDDPKTVVAEMNEVEELMFMSDYADQIVQSITPVVEVAKTIAREKAAQGFPSDGSTREPLLSDLVVESCLANGGGYRAMGKKSCESDITTNDGRVIQNITIEPPTQQQQQLPTSHLPAHTFMPGPGGQFLHGHTSGGSQRGFEQEQGQGRKQPRRAISDSRIPYATDGTVLQL